MMNKPLTSLGAILSKQNEYIYPRYGGESLLNVPSTILSLFGLPPIKKTLPGNYFQNALNAEKIILLLVDGLGDNLFRKEALKFTFFKNIADMGFYRPITTVFPSTTAAAITTLNSGLSPLEHGLPEWFVYFEELDCVIQTLPFVPVVSADLKKMVSPPEGLLFDQKTIYETLKEENISSFVFLHEFYSGPYNKATTKGATVVTYKTPLELIAKLKKTIQEVPGKIYCFVYFAEIDSAEHTYGPQSAEVVAELSIISSILQNEFVEKIETKLAEKVAILLTADHGQVPVNPKKTIYLDKVAGFVKNLKVSPQGNMIPPSGSARDVFVHAKTNKIESQFKLLTENLKRRAQVLKMEDVVNQGLFGTGKMHPKFLSRVGNILILPNDYNTVWYRFTPDTKFNLLGYHGGLSREEMMIPFICARLSELKK